MYIEPIILSFFQFKTTEFVAMSCFFSFFCCFPSQPRNKNSSSTCHATLAAAGGRPDSRSSYGNIYGINDARESTSSLPRYTERPMSIYEKTVVFGRGTNPQNLEGWDALDEKRQQQFSNTTNDNDTNDNDDGDNNPTSRADIDDSAPNSGSSEDQSSDASSTFSIPSSYGNTSTATRTPPPPPYSSNTSRSPSQRTRSMSLTRTDDAAPATPEIQQPQPVRHRDQDRGQWFSWNVDAGPRRSLDSGRSTPPLPPSYSRT